MEDFKTDENEGPGAGSGEQLAPTTTDPRAESVAREMGMPQCGHVEPAGRCPNIATNMARDFYDVTPPDAKAYEFEPAPGKKFGCALHKVVGVNLGPKPAELKA